MDSVNLTHLLLIYPLQVRLLYSCIISYTYLDVRLYLPYETRVLPDYSMIYASQFHDVDHTSDGISDALYCQSANTGSNIGLWYRPDGTQVPLYTGPFDESSQSDSNPPPGYEVHIYQ